LPEKSDYNKTLQELSAEGYYINECIKTFHSESYLDYNCSPIDDVYACQQYSDKHHSPLSAAECTVALYSARYDTTSVSNIIQEIAGNFSNTTVALVYPEDNYTIVLALLSRHVLRFFAQQPRAVILCSV